ncbi:NYN domain-containing protein [Glomus cerebriforme]|uniref:NYN domain-containing protein n=1 Tax=Glomus cerebriforme TaxID=658196 RepID=A0A397SY29_9GLOM|nr:NYN domain-containing protein [Glomus cerebriforme]
MSNTANTSSTSLPTVKGRQVYVFIDHSNVFIQGKKSTSIKKASDIDYVKLLEIVLNGRKTGQNPIIVGSYGAKDDPRDQFWERLRMNGFTVTLFERKFKEKSVDARIIVDICKSIFTRSEPATIILIAGDRDYECSLSEARNLGWDVEIWFWRKGFAQILKNMATKFRILKFNDVIDHVSDHVRRKRQKKGRQITSGIQPNHKGKSKQDSSTEETMLNTLFSGIQLTKENDEKKLPTNEEQMISGTGDANLFN